MIVCHMPTVAYKSLAECPYRAAQRKTHTVKRQPCRPNPNVPLSLPRLDIHRMSLITPHPGPERPLFDDVLGDHIPDDEERARGRHPCFQRMRAEEGVVPCP